MATSEAPETSKLHPIQVELVRIATILRRMTDDSPKIVFGTTTNISTTVFIIVFVKVRVTTLNVCIAKRATYNYESLTGELRGRNTVF